MKTCSYDLCLSTDHQCDLFTLTLKEKFYAVFVNGNQKLWGEIMLLIPKFGAKQISVEMNESYMSIAYL